MKKLYILILTFSCIALNAQVTVVAEGLLFPDGLAHRGDDLYFTHEEDFSGQSGKMSRIDVTDSTPTIPTEVLKIVSPLILLFNNNELYISQFNAAKISKIDITASTPEVIDIVTGEANNNLYYGLALKGNDLYFSDLGEGEILKIDITAPNPVTPTLVLNGLEFPSGLALKGNDLYITETGKRRIIKIDISASNPTPVDVLTGADLGQAESLAFNGNDLYISDSFNGKIVKTNISSPNQGAIEVLTGLEDPVGLAVIGDYLYFSEFSKISKLNLSTLSTVEDPAVLDAVVLYPNPSSNYIHISGLTKTENYRIYNTLGAEIAKGEVANKAAIDIQNLSSGMYFLKFENANVLKFNKK